MRLVARAPHGDPLAAPFHARLELTLGHDAAGSLLYRAVMSDVTERVKTQTDLLRLRASGLPVHEALNTLELAATDAAESRRNVIDNNHIFSGGHVYPALAVVPKLRQQCAELDLLWIGSSGGMEQALVERAAGDRVGHR